MKLDDKRIYRILLLLYIGAVVMLCLMNPESLPSVERLYFGLPADKIVHFIMFFPYPVLAGLSFMHQDFSILRNLTILLVLVVAGAGMAYGTEVLQGQTGYRSYDLTDFAADMTGMASGIAVTLIFTIIQKIRK